MAESLTLSHRRVRRKLRKLIHRDPPKNFRAPRLSLGRRA